jgi:hypothetical protein
MPTGRSPSPVSGLGLILAIIPYASTLTASKKSVAGEVKRESSYLDVFGRRENCC